MRALQSPWVQDPSPSGRGLSSLFRYGSFETYDRFPVTRPLGLTIKIISADSINSATKRRGTMILEC